MTKEIVLDQAVILCGGLGTRLRPLTDSLPKPMVSVNDRPFLFYLLKQLSEKGITRFVLLTGYLSEKIVDYFGDGSQYGWAISYSTGPTDWDTGRRVWEARGQLDEQFLLLYSDNYIQFNLAKLKKLHQDLAPALSLLLAPKSKGNIKVSEDGLIQAYDKTRSGDGFDFVEVGYMLVERDAILNDFANQLNFPDFSFSAVLQGLAQQQKIAGLVVCDAYHSISDPARLVLMSDYLKPKKILLIDRDGTMNEKAPSGEYITNKDQFKWIPETLDALKELSKFGFKFIVITNQAGIARKMIEPDALEEIHKKLTADLEDVGVEVLRVYMCPDHWDVNSLMRKPAPGMFFQAAREFNLRMDRCLYVGDDERDCIAAANAGCGMVYLSNRDVPPTLDEFPNTFFMSTGLMGAVSHIKDTYRSWESRV
jgi:D-glycero-D-manno-heptose 1,7-bisphosphate phosphatase